MFKKDEIGEASFIIAEVGQNHQGDVELAKEYVRVFAAAGADAIKFQTRNNKYLFSKEAYNATYESENAFGETYGEHREALELNATELSLVKEECNKSGVKFMSTAFDEPSLDLLIHLKVDILKIASFDLGNLPFLTRIASSQKPVIMSTGGGTLEHIRVSVECIKTINQDLSVLHCVSEYPCSHDRLGLNKIEKLKQEFPDLVIGLSDHFNGILSGPVGYLKGARVFEKHVTLNRAAKGTDHSFALEADGFRRFVRDIKRVPHMLPEKKSSTLGTEPVFKKLGKSLVALADIEADEIISIKKLTGRIFKTEHIPVRESMNVIGAKANKVIRKGDAIKYEDLKP
jgi:sialic acid synthase